ISQNWRLHREVFDDWAPSIVTGIRAAGLSAETPTVSTITPSGEDLAADIIACGEVIAHLYRLDEQIDVEAVWSDAIKLIHETVTKALRRLSAFHIHPEDHDAIRRILMLQAPRLYGAILEREVREFHAELRSSAIDDPPAEPPAIPFGEVHRRFRHA